MIQMTLAAIMVTAFATPAFSQPQAADHASHHVAQGRNAVVRSDGEVRKVDKEAQKITIRHGPLVHLGMPAMTMVFQVKDPTMLDKVATGDKITFVAEKIGGAFTVTEVDVAK